MQLNIYVNKQKSQDHKLERQLIILQVMIKINQFNLSL